MILIMPLAGKGSRFLAQGYTTPKPLIEIKGKPMIQWSFDAIKDFHYDKLLFILRKEQEEETGIATSLQKMYPQARVVLQNGFLNGAVLSVLEAREQINTDEAIAIYNPDQYFAGPSAIEVDSHFNEGVTGLIPVFYATHPKWSFALVGDNGYVSRVAEKEPISTNATVGMYIFKHGKDFVWGADQMIEKDIRVNNEFYVCPVYNELIDRGDKVKVMHSEFMWGLGTPEDVEYFDKYYSTDRETANNMPL